MFNDVEILRADVETLKKELRDLRSLIPPEIIQTVPKGVNWNLMSANSIDPGHLHTSSGISGVLSLAKGGTNKAMTASNGAVAYSDADSLELTAVGTSGQFFQSAGAGTPVWADLTAVDKVHVFSTEAVVQNTVTETNLVSFTLPANELSTNNALYGRLYIKVFDGFSGDTFTVKLYYAGTSISDTVSIGSTITNLRGYLDFWIVADGATNDQNLSFELNTHSSEGLTGSGSTAYNYGTAGEYGIAAIDSTSAQTVKVTLTFNQARNDNNMRVSHGFAYIIK